MRAPISWLKDYVDIKLPLKELMWKMTEIGLTTEVSEKIDGEEVLAIEVTPNRPDWLSVIGIAREISIIENSRLTLPALPEIPKKSANLPISVKVHPDLVGRYTGVTISNVFVKPSPSWMQNKLKLMGLRPINNLVDITNFVMFEMGIPIHVFDYDKFKNHKLKIELSKGGEGFTSVDGISYKLPANALVIKDENKVIDLCGIKGGKNSGISETTKNIFIHIPIYSPQTIRKTSQSIKLGSEASYIYERGPDLGGTQNVLKRVTSLVLKLAGGEVASEVIDIKKNDYLPTELALSLNKLEKVLGMNLPKDKVVKILKKLNLSPKEKKESIVCVIPTFRGDLKIEEDLIEEVARIYGYNDFPKTLPEGTTPRKKISHFFDPKFHNYLKNLMVSAGFNEIQTLSLTSEETIKKSQLNLETHIKIANPVSAEFKYLRTSLVPNLLSAVNLNKNENSLKLFELNKVYSGPIDDSREVYKLSAVTNSKEFRFIKGIVDLILEKLNIEDLNIKTTLIEKSLWHPLRSGVVEKGESMLGTFGKIHPQVTQNFEIEEDIWGFELEVSLLEKFAVDILFKPIPKYPPQIEDITLVVPKGIAISKVIQSTKSVSSKIADVQLKDVYKDSFTFRVWYQNPNKTLSDKEVEEVRKKILSEVKNKFKVNQKF